MISYGTAPECLLITRSNKRIFHLYILIVKLIADWQGLIRHRRKGFNIHMKYIKNFTAVLLFVLFMFPMHLYAKDSSPEEMITFNFVDVEIPTVIRFISELTDDNFIFDERIKGKITIIAPTKLSIKESFDLFTSVLSLKGYTIVPSGPKTYKIIPSSMAKQSGIMFFDKSSSVNETYITKLISTKYIKAEDTLQFLRPVISRDGHISVFGPRSLLLIVDSALNIEKITSILEKIDNPSVSLEEASINVYFLENADAIDLSKVLQGVIKDLEAAAKQSRTANKKKTFTSQSTVLRVTPDKTTNSLIIVAAQPDYEKILAVIKTLDKKRKQVYVEAMIVEASIDRLKELGTKWRATATHDGDPVVIGGFGNVNTGTMQSILTGLTGFSAGGLGDFMTVPVSTITPSGTIATENLTVPGFAALFSMNYFEDSVNILSTPQILTSDNEEAEIIVGENVPFISNRETDITTSNTVLNSIERKNVGITLRITPQITEGDYIKLDIYQEISAVKQTTESIFTSVGPTTTMRSTKTSISAKDGQTVVIGGLMQEQERTGVSKTPFLGDIPLIGWLFKFKTTEKDKKNLLVFLTPHIIKASDVLSEITEKQREKIVPDADLSRGEKLIIKFRDNVSSEIAAKIIVDKSAVIIKQIHGTNIYNIRLKTGVTVEDAIKEFSEIDEIEYAEPDHEVQTQGALEESGDAVNDLPVTEGPAELPAGPAVEDKPENEQPLIVEPTAETETADTVTEEADAEAAQKTAEPSAETSGYTIEVMTELRRMHPADKSKAVPTDNVIKPRHFIQTGAWTKAEYADESLNKILPSYPSAYMVKEDSYNKVRIPASASDKENSRILRDLKEKFNINPVLVNNSK